ncbi:zinc finger, CCHC-type, retrotransposon gag domain protein [Tanacetum coccineum]
MEKLENEKVSLEFQVQSLVKERENVIMEYQKLFDSIKKTGTQNRREMDELIENVNQKTYAYGDVIQIVLCIVDSGCSKHMTANLKLLKIFVEKFMGTVRFENDHFAAIIGYGDYVHGNVTICHVYYVEGLGHNLFSVGQFCDGDLEVAFRSKTCYVCNLEGDDLLTGARESNLYTISISDMAASSPGKSKKATLPPKLVPSTRSKLELIHMDLCGPMRVESINGKKYILLIVDDYSRYTWVYFLRTKDEAPKMIKKFIAQVQLNFKVQIQKVRTDNGIKYFSFGRHLDELHVTWAHLEKKRTRLRTNTKTLEDLCSQSLETASQAIHDAVTTHQVTASQHFMTASARTDSNADLEDSTYDGENVGNVIVNGNRVGYSYKEFLACNPKEYDGKGGAVVLTRWIEKIESVHDMSGCSVDQKVKYTGGSFVEFCPSHEMQKLESELWNHAMVGVGHAAYIDRFHELARLVPHLSKTIQKAVQISGALTDEAVRNGSIKKVEKRGNIGEPSKDKNGRDDNKRTKTGNFFATTINPDCRGVPRNVNPINARNPTIRACYECGSTDHVRSACPRLNRAQGSEENHPNKVASNNGGQGHGNQGNQARGRAFMLGAEEACQDPNIVTGTFTLNNHFATTLFDSGADYSFVSTTFIPLLGIKPSDLGFRYEIEIASGQLVEIDKVIKGCKLEIEGHVFDIDLIPFGHGSFDVIIASGELWKIWSKLSKDEDLLKKIKITEDIS